MTTEQWIMCLNYYRDKQISTALILFANCEDMIIVFNIPLCDYRNEMLTDIEHIRKRNKDIAEDRVRAQSDENKFFHKGMLCILQSIIIFIADSFCVTNIPSQWKSIVLGKEIS